MARNPRDPNLTNAESEFGWGPGMFPPGVADTAGPDFGERHGIRSTPTTNQDNYARTVADRRTDPTDPTSERDFKALGNPDRFGAQPPLVRSRPPARTRPIEAPPVWPPLKRER